jgi:hypothetical protein
LGLAQARMLVRALSWDTSPALATDTVCCSMTWFQEVRGFGGEVRALRWNALGGSCQRERASTLGEERPSHNPAPPAPPPQTSRPQAPKPFNPPPTPTTCSMARAPSLILSNSSMQQMPFLGGGVGGFGGGLGGCGVGGRGGLGGEGPQSANNSFPRAQRSRGRCPPGPFLVGCEGSLRGSAATHAPPPKKAITKAPPPTRNNTRNSNKKSAPPHLVAEHQGAALQHHLIGLGVLGGEGGRCWRGSFKAWKLGGERKGGRSLGDCRAITCPSHPATRQERPAPVKKSPPLPPRPPPLSRRP